MNAKILLILFLAILPTACQHMRDTIPTRLTTAHTYQFIDAHTQIPYETDVTNVLNLMTENGVMMSQIAARSGTSGIAIKNFATDYPAQIRAMIKTKGRDYVENTADYYTKLAARGASSEWHGIGEVMIYHAAKRGGSAPEVDVAISDRRVQAALDVAINRGWPLIIHIEFASLSPGRQAALMADLKNLLAAYPNQPFAMIHMAQLKATVVKSLLTTYSNIYFLTSHTNPAITSISSQPWTKMFANGRLKPKWKSLMITHPTRFVFALDNVWPKHWTPFLYNDQINYWKTAVSELPVDVAHAFAYGNAKRLWSLP